MPKRIHMNSSDMTAIHLKQTVPYSDPVTSPFRPAFYTVLDHRLYLTLH